MNMTLTVGDLLEWESQHPWTGPAGKGTHRFRLLVEITEIGEHNAKWKLVYVLDEEGAPPENARPTPETGGFAIRFLDDLIAEGSVRPSDPQRFTEPCDRCGRRIPSNLDRSPNYCHECAVWVDAHGGNEL